MARGRAAKVADAAVAFAALGDPIRLRIVARLGEAGPASIAALTAVADVTRQAITKHLAALEAAGLVEGARSGRERIWELRPHRLAEIGAHLETISGEWDLAIGRLKAMVEDS